MCTALYCTTGGVRGRSGGGPRPQVPHRGQDRVQEPAQAAVPVITVPINIYLPLSTNYYLQISIYDYLPTTIYVFLINVSKLLI